MLDGDSIFFKMEFWDRIDNKEWNVSYALDTNLNPSDGAPWTGLNTSLNFDLNFRVFYHPGFPHSGYIVDANQIGSGYSYSFELVDTATFVAGLSLSEHGITGPFNFIGGTGLAIGDINDDIPDIGYSTVLVNGIKEEKYNAVAKLSVYPNPAGNYLKINLENKIDKHKYQFEILDLKGRVVLSDLLTDNIAPINIESLPTGVYTFRIFNEEISNHTRFQKD